MIYFIAGASRAGKTYLAKQLMTQLSIPLLELDYLKMGLANGVPEYGIHPLQDETTLGGLLWPIVKAMVRAMVENEDDYIIEGCYILPEFVAQVRKEYGDNIRACFLGYADTSPLEKLVEVRKYGGEPGDPLREYDDSLALSNIERFVSFSQFVHAECAQLGFPYFEVKERDQAVEQAIKEMLKGSNKQK